MITTRKERGKKSMQQNLTKVNEEEIKEEVNEEEDDILMKAIKNYDDLELDEDEDEDEDEIESDGDTLTPTEDLNEANPQNQNEEGTSDMSDDFAEFYQGNGTNNNNNNNGGTEQQNANNTNVNVKYVPQNKVNEIAAQARKEGRESAMRELLLRYGVGNSEELDDLFGRGQSYTDLDNDYTIQSASYRDALAENALLKTGINQERWEDVKLILGGKNLEITPENIQLYLASHPEWKSSGSVEKKQLTPDMAQNYADNIGNNVENNGSSKPTTLKKLGNEASPIQPEMTEEELARKLYGFK